MNGSKALEGEGEDYNVIEILNKRVDSLLDTAGKIPDWILDGVTNRAVGDAKKLMEKDIGLEQLSYALYRAYIIGIALGIEKKDEILEDKK